MTILLFGISCVGKTTTGEKLAQRLGFDFFDLDEEVKEHFQITLEEFVQTGWLYERDQKRGQVLGKIMEKPQDKVVAIAPMYYARNFNKFLSWPDVLAIELQDLPEHVFDRIVFSDEEDRIYHDDEYKNQHREHYLSEVKKDITHYKRAFAKVENKFRINNDPVDTVVERIIKEYSIAPPS